MVRRWKLEGGRRMTYWGRVSDLFCEPLNPVIAPPPSLRLRELRELALDEHVGERRVF